MLFRAIEDSKVQIGARLGPRIGSNFGPPLHDLGDFNNYHFDARPKDSSAMVTKQSYFSWTKSETKGDFSQILEDEAFARSLVTQDLMHNPTGPYAAAAKKVKPPSGYGSESRNVFADPAKWRNKECSQNSINSNISCLI